MTNDNSAARLVAILNSGKAISKNFAAQDAWKRILNIPGNSLEDHSLLMAKLGQVMLLPHEIKRLVEQYYPSQVPALTHTLNQIQSAFIHQNLNGKWNSFIDYIDDHCLSTLSMTTALLENKLDTKLMDLEEIDTFKVRIQELIDDTINSTLTSEFKRFMTHYLQKILTAINDYLISGAMPILSALEATIGHAVLDPSFTNELKETETGAKILNTLGDLANIVTLATAATGAIAYISSNGFPLLN